MLENVIMPQDFLIAYYECFQVTNFYSLWNRKNLMNHHLNPKKLLCVSLIIICLAAASLQAQSKALKTPLSQELLTLLTNEISGQFSFNNEVILAGAPSVRDPMEFNTTCHESPGIYVMVR